MSENQRYNGWTNWATWNVKLWIDNDEGSHEYFAELVRTEFKDDPGGLASLLKLGHEDLSEAAAEKVGHGVMRDFISHSFDDVNWHEIAKALIEEHAEDEEVAA